ncbi:MAG: inositol monophosphatase [Bacteroidaceae bacterium]|nr:inositol monophosphatase [Bacteroidaceae bacterium]
MDYKKLTEQVCAVAREAGEYLRREQHKLREEQVIQKRAHDYVSYVDKTSENMIVCRLQELLPDAGFLTEEGTAASLPSSSYYWVIDPLDGTTNYVHGFNPFAVSIALRSECEILLGVVYEVSLDECFYAWQGGGAWLNGNAIQVKADHQIGQAMLGLELPYDVENYTAKGQSLIRQFYGRCSGIRMNGSAAMGICNVAAGRWDGWVERYIKPWDFMAAALIVMEAGGKVTNFAGNEMFLDGDDIVASNGTIQQDLLKAIESLP